MLQWVKDLVLSVAWVTALAQVPSLALELPHAMGTTKKEKKKKKKKREEYPGLSRWAQCTQKGH